MWTPPCPHGLRRLVSKPYYDIRDPWRKLISRARSRRYEEYGLLRLHPLIASVIAWLSSVPDEEVFNLAPATLDLGYYCTARSIIR